MGDRAKLTTGMAEGPAIPLGLSMHSPRPNTIRLEGQDVGDEEVVVAMVVCQRAAKCTGIP
jgi:hypothetical protein